MNVIRNKDGKIIQRSRNLAGIRRFVSKRGSPPIKVLSISVLPGDKGKLCILFKNGDSYETNFADIQMLLRWIYFWLAIVGCQIRIDGLFPGHISAEQLAQWERRLGKYTVINGETYKQRAAQKKRGGNNGS